MIEAQTCASEYSSAQRELLKHTTSRCPVCQKPCPAEVWRVGDAHSKVYLERTCPEHGFRSTCISSDARFYWLSKGDPSNACCGSAHRASDHSIAGTLGQNSVAKPDSTFEKLSTCVALIEIVNSCNLSCPTCYADSPAGTGAHLEAFPLSDLQRRIQNVIDRKGVIDILQLSGGEPTLHPQFFELVDWAQSNPNIKYVLLNTNGVRIANDKEFAANLALAAQRKNIQLYLQFDGTEIDGQHALRGADLRATRIRAIERCRDMRLPITLAMTVTPDNISHLWKAIDFGLSYTHIRGISFQPMFHSGRKPSADGHLNTADIIVASVEQSGGRLRFDDFTPLPCGDPNCATIGYLIKKNGVTYSISNFINFANVQSFLHDRVRYRLEDLMKCGCESEPLGAILKKFELDESNTFRLFVKPFMDAWTWDEDRIDRCCTHVIRPDGKLDSFCRYYSGFPDTKLNGR